MTKKLKEIRLDRKLSQSQLAEKTGLNVRTLQHYEQGSKNFNNAKLDTLLKVCLVLKCKLEDIIDDQDILNLINEYKKGTNN